MTTLRQRRFRPLGLLLAGLLAVAGCSSPSPELAARVGDVRLTHEQVDDMLRTIEADAAGALNPDAWGELRQYVVQATVFGEIARRYSAEKGLPAPEFDYEATSRDLGNLPTTNPLVRLATEAEAYRVALLGSAQQLEPTEEQLQDAYQRFAEVVGESVAPYEQVKPQLQGFKEFGAGLWLREELTAAAQRYGVEVSPRYRPLSAPLTVVIGGTQQVNLVELPLAGPPTDAVRDVS